jgi:hypothetical protein
MFIGHFYFPALSLALNASLLAETPFWDYPAVSPLNVSVNPPFVYVPTSRSSLYCYRQTQEKEWKQKILKPTALKLRTLR